MKKVVAVAVFLVLVAAVAVGALKYFPAGSSSAIAESSERAASDLQTKIDVVKKAEADKNRRQRQKLDVSEAELESYVMLDLKKQIPFPMDSIRVHLTPGFVAADSRLTIPPGSTGNILTDALVGGSHNFYVKGKLTGMNGVGKFDIQDVTVDGIPVPVILVDTLVRKYAKPKHPEVDIRAPFELPWGIDAVEVGQGKGTVTY